MFMYVYKNNYIILDKYIYKYIFQWFWLTLIHGWLVHKLSRSITVLLLLADSCTCSLGLLLCCCWLTPAHAYSCYCYVVVVNWLMHMLTHTITMLLLLTDQCTCSLVLLLCCCCCCSLTHVHVHSCLCCQVKPVDGECEPVWLAIQEDGISVLEYPTLVSLVWVSLMLQPSISHLCSTNPALGLWWLN